MHVYYVKEWLGNHWCPRGLFADLGRALHRCAPLATGLSENPLPPATMANVLRLLAEDISRDGRLDYGDWTIEQQWLDTSSLAE